MIRRIATIAVYVEDQQQAKQFWTEKAGFDVAAEHPMGPNAFWLEVAPKGADTPARPLSESHDEGLERTKTVHCV